MSKFVGQNGIIIETDDAAKIDALKSMGCRELDELPTQAGIEIKDEFTVKKAKKGKKGV